MSDCNNPTLYPVVLSSIDGECVFAEYNLSAGIENNTWNQIHSVVMWCCPWLYYWDNDDVPPPRVPATVMVPNSSNPANVTTIHMSNRAGIADTTFPGGIGYYDQTQQFNELAGGAAGTGNGSYWEAFNPASGALFAIELGNEVDQNTSAAKYTFICSSLSAGVDNDANTMYRLGIDSSKTVAFSGTGTGVSFGTSGVSRWSVKLNPCNNNTFAGLADVSAGSVSGATVGQVLTKNSAGFWCASNAPAGGGGGYTDVGDYVYQKPDSGSGNFIVPQSTGTCGVVIAPPTSHATYDILVYQPGNQNVDTALFYVNSTDELTYIKNLKITTGGADPEFSNHRLLSVADPTALKDGANKEYVDQATSAVSGNYVLKDGSVAFTGAQEGVSGTGSSTLTTKEYVDTYTSATSAVGSIDHNSLANLTTGDPHTQYLTKSPSTTGRNTITQGASSRPPFAITPHASNSVNITNWYNSGGSDAAYIDKDHNFATSGSVSGAILSGTEFFTAGDANVSGDVLVNGRITLGDTTLGGGDLVVRDDDGDATIEINSGSNNDSFIHYRENNTWRAWNGWEGAGNNFEIGTYAGNIYVKPTEDFMIEADTSTNGTVTAVSGTGGSTLTTKDYVDSVTVSDVWVRDIPIHGNSIYYNGSVFTAANPGIINNTDFDSAAAILQMAAAADRAGQYQFRVCEDLDVSQDIKLFLMFNLTGSPGASDTVVFDFNGRARGTNESFTAGGHLFSTVTTTTTIGSGGSGHSSGDLLEIDQGVVIPGGTLNFGDFVTFTVMRDVSADSFGGNTQMLGMTLLGTKRKLA